MTASLVMDITRLLVIAGYVWVVYLAIRNSRQVARRGHVALRLMAFAAGSWVAFYIWVGGLPTFGTGATYNEVVLASRLAHVPTIGVLVALTFIVVDASNARDRQLRLWEKAGE